MNGHDLNMYLIVPVAEKEAKRLLNNQRVTFKNVDPQSGTVRDSFLACTPCERQFASVHEVMTTICPGEPTGYADNGLPYWDPAPDGYPSKEEAEQNG